MTPPYRRTESERITSTAERSIAGGVVSINRKVDPGIVFVRAQGSHIWDADGNQYVDYHAAFAPHLLGHNHPAVNAAVKRAMEEGLSLMGTGTTSWEIRLAELLCEHVASLDCVQITNTGSEATALAIRLSRAYTARDDLVLMLGGYNGWHDDVGRAVMPSLDQVGPRVSPGQYPFIPISAGIPEATRRRLHIVGFNDLDSVEYVMRRYPVACVLTEPILQNIGVVKPQPGYLQGLRALCDRHGSVLIFDEVKTGFRHALAGYQSIAGVTPDLSVFGKAVANGYPLGVIGGKRDIMQLFATQDVARRVLIAGTYNAHPFTSAAAIATIEHLASDSGFYRRLEGLGARLETGLMSLFRERGIPGVVARQGSAFCVYFCEREPVDWHDILAHHDFARDLAYRRALVERGIYHFPAPCKQGSLSAAHTDADVDRTLEVTREVLQEL